MIHLYRITYSILLICAVLAGREAYGAPVLPGVPPPVPVPNGDPAFVGSVNVGFQKMPNGKIIYTLDGTVPSSKNGVTYQDGASITIAKTTLLRAVHIFFGFSSNTVDANFIRAKLPAPVAGSGGVSSFYPSVTCTLTVAASASYAIRYTTDGSAPDASSPQYSAALTFAKTTTLRAFATAAGYDDSDPMQAVFTLLDPAATPTANPVGEAFDKPLAVSLKTATAGAVIHYSVAADTSANLESAPIYLSDSIVLAGKNAGETLILRAQAFKTGYPPSAVMTEKYQYLPQVSPPVPSHAGGFFYDIDTVTFSSATAGASIRYTAGATAPPNPTSASPLATGPIIFSSDTVLTAVAFKAPQPQSLPVSNTYTLRLTAPTADKASRDFKDTITVKLSSACPGANIYYTLDSTLPTTQSALYTAPISLSKNDTTYLRAIAVKGNAKSDPSRVFIYVKSAVVVKLHAPAIDPAGREFMDSLRITLSTDDSDAEIRYTLDGSFPTAASTLYKNSILIDTTTTLHAQAFPIKTNFQASVVSEEKYVLTPSPPIATPDGNGSYQNQVQVSLSTNTRGGAIYYVLGNQPLDLSLATLYKPSEPIILKATTTLRAVTILGIGADQRKSVEFSQTFVVYSGIATDTLPAGSSRSFSGGFLFTNSSSVPILAKVRAADSLGIVGFKDAGLAVVLQPIQAGQAIQVTFTKPADQIDALYRIVNGSVQFVSADSRADISAAGDYFVGIDTLPPTITLISQTPKPGDSTVVKFLVKDNVASPSCEIVSAGLPDGKLTRKADSSGIITAGFKNAGPEPKGLWFRAQASDFYNSGHLPQDPQGKYFLGQSWNTLNTPSVLTLGRKVYPWDMVGLPLSANAPMTWTQLRKDNPDADLAAAVLQDSADYTSMTDDSLIRPGESFWLRSGTPLKSLALSQFKAGESESDGSYRITLHRGWNQISSPSLDVLYWPISRKDPKFEQSLVKGLYAYAPELLDYAPSDSLEPWKGYFVYSYFAQDTAIALFADSVGRALAKPAASQADASTEGVEIALDFGRPIPLTLGADALAEDGFATEDELQLPAWKPDFSAWSQRGKRHLITDRLRYEPQSLLQWEVVVADSTRAHGHAQGSNSMHVLTDKLPAGYQAWAVSRVRGMKFRIEEGAALPLEGAAGDTLAIYAGPLAKLSGIPELSQAALSVDKFVFSLETEAGHSAVNLALPWKCRVDITLWSVTGSMLAEIHPGELGQGLYHLPLTVRKSPRLSLLRIQLRGPGIDRQITQKAAW